MPTLEYELVACPVAFVQQVQAAFTASGVARFVFEPAPPPGAPGRLPFTAPFTAEAPPMVSSPTAAALVWTDGSTIAVVLACVVSAVVWWVWARARCSCCGGRSHDQRVRTKGVRGRLTRLQPATKYNRADATSARAASSRRPLHEAELMPMPVEIAAGGLAAERVHVM